jgi:D-alanyl-D-alanine dipeptidase
MIKSFKSLSEEYPEKSGAQINAIVSHFIAPENRSTHASGGAVDALIYDIETGRILDFGTNEGHDIDLGVKCYPYHPEISIEAQSNRKLLISAFEKEGFVVDLKEFWHFDYGNVAWAAFKEYSYALYGPIFN